MFYSKIDIINNKEEWRPKNHEKTNIYFLIDECNEVVYVGQSVDVHKRVGVHTTNREKDFAYYSSFECEKDKANDLEDMYITFLNPIYNKTLNKHGQYIDLIEVAEKQNSDLQTLVDFLNKKGIKPLFNNNYRATDLQSAFAEMTGK